jgi:hypothetical protein
MRSGSARDLCAASKDGLKMRVRHSLDTHRDRYSDFAGSHERISKMTSCDSEAAAAERT